MILAAFAAILASFEICIGCMAACVYFQRRSYTFAEGCAYGITACQMFISALFQITLILGQALVAMLGINLLALTAIFYLMRNRSDLMAAGHQALSFARQYRSAIIVAPILLALMILSNSPVAPSATFFFGDGTWSLTIPPSPLSSPEGFFFNHAIMFHPVLWPAAGAGTGTIGVMAYLGIAFSTYALARRYAWPPTALTVTLVVISMPRIIFLVPSPSGELTHGAAVLFCLLTLYRVVERPNRGDLLMLFLGINFTIHGGPMGLVFPTVLMLLTLVLLHRRHALVSLWKQCFAIGIHRVLPALLPGILFSQVWLLVYHRRVHGNGWVMSDAVTPLAYNGDGIMGTLSNLMRYLFQSIHLTAPVENSFRKVLDIDIMVLLEGLYSRLALPYFVDLGAAQPFLNPSWPDSASIWFGPFGFMLLWPAIGYALLKGPRRLKAVALAITAAVYLITLIPAWRPENVAYFTPIVVGAGFMPAFILPPWRFGRQRKRILQIVCLCLLAYGLAQHWAAWHTPL